MKLKKLFITFFLFIPLFSTGQGVSVLPSYLPKYIYGTWVNSKNEITLIVSSDYIVIQNELYEYNSIVIENNELLFTCINNDNIKYISICKSELTEISLDEGYKITKLTKLISTHLNGVPKSLVDHWYLKKDKIELTEDNVFFDEKNYKIDKVSTSNNTNYLIILYYESTYVLLYNMINENGHFLNVKFSKPLLFKKATLYQKNKNAVFIILTIIILCISSLFIRWKINSSKKNEVAKRLMLEMQLKSIRSQMNPHFLFNALSAIQNLVNRGDNEKANHYLTEFAQLMRLTLDKSEKGLVSLDEELKSIQKYIEIEKLRFPFNYKILTDSSINTHEIEIPAMLIQPIVENAIIHGLHQKKGDKTLSIEFKIKNNNLVCIVTDNGVGINATKSKINMDLNRQKYGMKLAKDRLDLINESYHTKAKISMVDLSDYDDKKTGTQVEISMPLKY